MPVKSTRWSDVDLATVPAPAVEEKQAGGLVVLCLAAWLVPGVGHLWLGHRVKGLIFLVVIPLMFAIGVAVQGRLFPIDFSEPLVGLMAIAEIGSGLPYLIADALGKGLGDVTAVTYEYGNTFIIVAGLLNLLIVNDAFDVAIGRK